MDTNPVKLSKKLKTLIGTNRERLDVNRCVADGRFVVSSFYITILSASLF